MTNDYYDIKIDRYGSPVTISKSSVTIAQEEIERLSAKKIEFNVNVDELAKHMAKQKRSELANRKTLYAYYKSDNRITPIVINYCTFKDVEGGLFCQEICIDLSSGTYIDYEDFVLAGK